jgi:3-oxoadipate CoA-transferase alpha subunit
MINKITTLDHAIADVKDGDTILIGGFGAAGTPHNLVEAVSDMALRDITLVANAPAQMLCWMKPDSVKHIKASFPIYPFKEWRVGPVTEAVKTGKITSEVVPQGTLAERIRAAGCGIPAFYTPVGVGTRLGEERQTAVFGGRTHLLEMSLPGDIALIKGHKADRLGNVVYRMAQRNFNPVMATAARITIVEVDEIVEAGRLGPEEIATPGIYVNWVVQIPKKKIAHAWGATYDTGANKRTDGN